MLHIQTLVQARKTARALEKALAKRGFELKHGHALDALAHMCGFSDWNSHAQSLTPAVLDAQLHDFELSHIAGSGDEDYGTEAMLVAHTGFQLRYSAETPECDYVRVCDPLGRELMYWTHEEWAEDPQTVMGAILGALVRGKAASAPVSKRQVKTAVKAPLPSITDVNFMAVHAIIFDDICHSVVWREVEVLALLSSTDPEVLEQHGDNIALRLQYQDSEGFLQDDELTLETLAKLSWNVPQGQFFSQEGAEYRLVFEMSAEDWFRVHAPKGKPVVQSTTDSATTRAEVETWHLFSIEGSFKARKGPEQVPTKTRVAAPDAASAASYAKDIWDNSHAVLEVTSTASAKESEAGPFSVFVDGGVYDSVPYLEQAINLAEILLSESNDEVSIEDRDSNCVWRLLSSNDPDDEVDN